MATSTSNVPPGSPAADPPSQPAVSSQRETTSIDVSPLSPRINVVGPCPPEISRCEACKIRSPGKHNDTKRGRHSSRQIRDRFHKLYSRNVLLCLVKKC